MHRVSFGPPLASGCHARPWPIGESSVQPTVEQCTALAVGWRVEAFSLGRR
jgi:hypothetical protein